MTARRLRKRATPAWRIAVHVAAAIVTLGGGAYILEVANDWPWRLSGGALILAGVFAYLSTSAALADRLAPRSSKRTWRWLSETLLFALVAGCVWLVWRLIAGGRLPLGL